MSSDFCRFGQSSGLVCMEKTDGGRCDTHGQSRYSVCSGCGSDAIRACSANLPGGGVCDVGLCANCLHLEDGVHGTVTQADVTGSTDPGVKGMFSEIEKDLTGVIARILAEEANAGVLKFGDAAGPNQTATKVLRGLGLHLTVLNLSALARATQMGQ